MGLVKNKIATSLLGFSGGLPFLFTLSIFQVVLVDRGLSIESIGILGLVQLPYSLKFLWAWVFDRYVLFKTNRKNEWLYLVQVLIILNFLYLGTDLSTIQLILGFFTLGFLSANQDILIDLFRIETSSDKEIGLHSSLYVLSYRLALILVGSIGFILIDQYSFSFMVRIFSCLMVVGLVGTFLTNPISTTQKREYINYKQIFNLSFATVLLFLVTFKLGDTFADKLNILYFMDLGYTKTDLGVLKAITSWATIIGGIVSGASLKIIPLRRAFYIFGILQLLSTAGYILLAYLPYTYWSLGAIWSFEKLTAGMGGVVLISFMSIKSKELGLTSFYFTLFTSVVAFTLTTLSAASGALVEALSWQGFLIVCCIISLPGLFLVGRVVTDSENYDKN